MAKTRAEAGEGAWGGRPGTRLCMVRLRWCQCEGCWESRGEVQLRQKFLSNQHSRCYQNNTLYALAKIRLDETKG
jgi:hypothetical protein